MLLEYVLIFYVVLGITWISRNVIKQKSPKHKHVRRLPQRSSLLGFDTALMFAEWVRDSISLEKSAQWIQNNGKTFSVLIGGRVNVWTADAANAKAILAEQADVFELSEARHIAFRPVIGKGMIGVNGADWSQGRRLLVQSLPYSRVRNLAEYEPHFQNLLAHLPVDGRTVDLQALLPLYTMDTITQVLLGNSVKWLKAADQPAIRDMNSALDYVNEVMRFRGDIGPFVHLHWNRQFNKHCSSIRAFVRSLMEDNSRMDGSKDLLFLKAYRDPMADKQKICDQLLTAIMAGRDTTASLIGFTIWSLARDERVQAKLRGLIQDIEYPLESYAELSSIPYLRHVVKEVLRLYPSIPANDRVANRDTHIPVGGGECGQEMAYIRAGQVIDIHVFAIHRDPSLWGDNADEFIPERWEERERNPGFMPFGGGPRTCPGQDLAMVQAAFVTVRLLQSCAWIESRDPLPFKEQVSISLTSGNGFKMAFLPEYK